MALQHSILITTWHTFTWHTFTTNTPYRDLTGTYFLDRASKTTATKRLIGQLNHLDFHVTLNPLGAT